MRKDRFKDKNIWITGASSGIGKALAANFASKGANLILSGRRTEILEDLKKKLSGNNNKIVVLKLDLEKQNEFQGLYEKVLSEFSNIDYLINNGGISQRAYSYEADEIVDRKVMEVNFFGTVALTKLVMKNMITKKSGHITVISSVSGKFGFPLRSAYAASKHALQGFFETLRLELKSKNINVLIVSPGRINTSISMNALDKDGNQHGKMDAGQKNGMDVDLCAEKIVNAIAKNKKDIIIGKAESFLNFIHNISIDLFDFLVGKVDPK